MKKIISLPAHLAIIALAIALKGCSLLTPLPDTVEQELENALDRGFDGIIVYVEQSGESSLYSAGWKNRENGVPADPHDLFKIASISKLYIAVAAAQMIHDKRLPLDRALAEYIPGLVGRIEHAEEITLRMMLKHRSGIPNFTDMPDYPWSNPPKDNREILKLVLDRPADFEPNQKYQYSNTNYLLIGEIMDSTLGYSHHQYIKANILNPLGLNHTYSLLGEVDLDAVMSGYHVGYEHDIKYNDFIQPGGSMVATAEEVGIFLRALIDGSLLDEDEQAIYTSLYKYEHTGLLPGYQSIAKYNPDLDAVIVQFVNTSGPNMWMKSETVYRRIVRILKKQ